MPSLFVMSLEKTPAGVKNQVREAVIIVDALFDGGKRGQGVEICRELPQLGSGHWFARGQRRIRITQAGESMASA